ncbi:MAG: Lrp/AsnC family transcriptional regulator [Candidatus Bathyarchaeota archaeon]
MDQIIIKRNKRYHEDDILNALIEDPTKSAREIARRLGSYRQKVWRRKKELEIHNVIWGYTAVVDETKTNHVSYMILMKMKPMSKELAQLMVNRMLKGEPYKQHVHLTNVLYVNGEYDLIIKLSAHDHAIARRYYDSLRIAYAEYLLEKPVIVDVNFQLIKEGKTNPEISKLYEFVPV